MPFSRMQYEDGDLAAMQAAYNGACLSLGLDANADSQRRRLAEIICAIAKTTHGIEADVLERQAVARFKELGLA